MKNYTKITMNTEEKKEKILLTGGSGFIGTNLIELLLKKGYIPINIDYNKPKNKNHIKYWQNIDINDIDKFQKAVENFSPDFIVHLAARTDLTGEKLLDYKTNVLGVENLMKITQKIPSLKKMIITSSMLVCRPGYNPKDQFDYSPSTIYGESKVETERLVWANKPNCDWAIIRPTSIWGPWFSAPYRSFFDMVLDGKYFHIGNKGCTKTYGYVGNAIYQIENILLSNTKSIPNKVFYIGDYMPTSIKDWANEIAKELDSSIKTIPYGIFKMAAIFGDMLKSIGIKFPMSSFRLKNMTTNNIVDLSNTKEISPNLPYSRTEGIKYTLKWMEESKYSSKK